MTNVYEAFKRDCLGRNKSSDSNGICIQKGVGPPRVEFLHNVFNIILTSRPELFGIRMAFAKRKSLPLNTISNDIIHVLNLNRAYTQALLLAMELSKDFNMENQAVHFRTLKNSH